jgi:hypothetical protein
MSGREFALYRFHAWDALLLALLIAVWLGLTLAWGALSLLIWAPGVLIAAVLLPPHQRSGTPQSMVDVIASAVCWAVAGGAVGLLLDLTTPSGNVFQTLPWTLLGQLTGFYLGLLWTLAVLLFRLVTQRRSVRTFF